MERKKMVGIVHPRIFIKGSSRALCQLGEGSRKARWESVPAGLERDQIFDYAKAQRVTI